MIPDIIPSHKMNPSEKGWLHKYITYRKWALQGTDILSAIDIEQPVDKFLYEIAQPTGLMYGYPINLEEFSHPNAFKWDEKSRIKILLAESFIQCSLFFMYKKMPQPVDPAKLFPKIVDHILEYYLSTFVQYTRSGKTLLGKKKRVVDQVEFILERRTTLPSGLNNFWNSFFHNILLFFDLIYFVEWQVRIEDVSKKDLHADRLEIRMKLLRVIAAAAWADDKIDKEELLLYNHFLKSSKLSPSFQKKARSFVMQKSTLDDIDFSVLKSWLIKKYFLELATLVIWSDQYISLQEEEFLYNLNEKLNLEKNDLDHTALAIEGFVVEHWNDVFYLQQSRSYRIVSQRLTRRMSLIVRKNQKRIKQEVAESRELVKLLSKSRKTELTPLEKAKVRAQLIDILKTIPTFALLMMPGAFLTLPVLFKIVPKHVLFPSSFLDEED